MSRGAGAALTTAPRSQDPLQLLSSFCLKRRCGSFPPVCSGWLGASVQTAALDWCVDGWGLVCGWTAVPGPLTEAGGSFWASPHQRELWRGLDASSSFSSFPPEPWVRKLGTCSGTYPGWHSLHHWGWGWGEITVLRLSTGTTRCAQSLFL